jgi:hypothetical protein
MKLADFLAQDGNAESAQGNPGVTCNALSKTEKSFNCNLTVAQAVALARHLLGKAQIIMDHGLDDAVVQLYNIGLDSERLSCGPTRGRLGPRQQKKPAGSTPPEAAG